MKNRGTFLETVLNRTAMWMKENDIGVLINKPIDIVISNIINNKVSGYLKQKSTTDFYGCYNGKYYEIEAKQTNSLTSFPLSNIKEHQIEHLKNIEKHGGKGYLIIHFYKLDIYYMIEVDKLFLVNKKSITLNFLKKYGYELFLKFPGILNFYQFL